LIVCATDSEYLEIMERVTLYYMPLVLVPVGLCCNLLSLLVLARDKTMNPTTSFLLKMLALADILFIFIHPMEGLMHFQGLLSTVCRRAISVVCLVCLKPIVHTSAVWMVVVVTVERYIAITWSLHAARHITMTRVRTAVCVVWISSFVFSLPYCLVHKIRLDDEYTCTHVRSGLIDDNAFFDVYAPYITLIIVFALPLTLLIVFNSLLVKSIHRWNNMTRQMMTSRLVAEGHHISSNEQRVTYMAVGVISVFIVCQLPMAVAPIFYNILIRKSNIVFERYVFFTFAAIGYLLLVVNSLANFFIYFLLGSRFRSILVNCMQCRHRDRPHNARS